jgi:hypothetical protein
MPAPTRPFPKPHHLQKKTPRPIISEKHSQQIKAKRQGKNVSKSNEKQKLKMEIQ